MKIIKKIQLLSLTLILMITLIGCSTSEDKKEENFLIKASTFEQFVEKLPAEFISGDSMDNNFLFYHPENYGIKKELAQLPTISKKDYDNNLKESKLLLKQLKTFDYKKLNDEQKITYKVLEDKLKVEKGMEDFYYLDNNLLGSFVGFQAQLPLLLVEFTFNSNEDLEDYFNILKTSEKTFKSYADFEKKRQDKGVGMPKVILEKVIEQCDNFIKEDNIFLADEINNKIDGFTFLSDEEKQIAKDKNTKLVNEDLRKAYKTLGDELRVLLNSATDDDDGLASLKNGKEYYAYLFKNSTGSSMDPQEALDYLSDKEDQLMNEFLNIMLGDPSLASGNMPEMPVYTDKQTAEETLDYLGSRMIEDFPSLPVLNYSISQVPQSMKDNFSPAAYLSSHIDSPLDTKERIYMNGDFESSLYGTIAHEGYPGHMYQSVYFKSLQKDPIRYIMKYNGYSEGWATYVESYVDKYAQGDEKALKLWQLNSDLTKVKIATYDIKIHYEGMTREEFEKDIMKNFGVDKAAADEQYDLILETPANYNAYYFSYFLFQDLYEKASKELKDKFDPVAFHKVILDTGPSSFAILEKEVEAFIKANK